MEASLHKRIGFVATPRPVADELVGWAVRSKADHVLDLGAGEGVFLVSAASRLRELGAAPREIAHQLYGVEREEDLYSKTRKLLASELGTDPLGLVHSDFFSSTFPQVDALIGNPPYVRRASLDDVDRIRGRILHNNVLIGDIPRLTDLYAYFLLFAEQFLKPGGRLALVMSSAWLDTDYGEFLKRFLLDRFGLHAIVQFDERVFGDALVKAVLVVGVKKETSRTGCVRFARLTGFSSGILSELDASGEVQGANISEEVPQRSLSESDPWSVYLRAPRAYTSAVGRNSNVLGDFVDSRIGIQTLAGDFFILTGERVTGLGLSEEYLLPLVSSPRLLDSGILHDPARLRHRILNVREALEEIRDASLVQYIRQAEKTEVGVRGKGKIVLGYHELPRLKLARRMPWYNLADEIERRGRYEILFPRRFYGHFLVAWNKAGVVANENFVELHPRSADDLLVLLALLNTSMCEVVARSRAQLYGGGVYNLNPRDVKELPFFDLRVIIPAARKKLEAITLRYLAQPTDEVRTSLDRAVGDVFGLSEAQLDDVHKGLRELRMISRRAKKALRT